MNLVKIFSDAGATLGRIIQQAEEVFLDVPKTKYNEEYMENIKKVDFLIILTEKLILDARQYLNPNFENSERWTTLEEFGNALQNPVLGLKEMSSSLNEDLFKAGKYQRKLAFLMKNYQSKAVEQYVQKLKNILEVDLKNFKDEEAALELIRLDHDYLKNRVENAFTSAGKEALEKEYEKTRSVFESHYDSTLKLFRTADSYFILHRQLLKEFIEIERNYHRECDKNLSNLLRKLHSDAYRIAYDIQFDYDGFISTSDVDERIKRKAHVELSKVSEKPELENKFSPIQKHGEKFERFDENGVYEHETSVHGINDSVVSSSQGFPSDENEKHSLITNGISKSHPLRVVIENENEGRTLDSSLNASSGNDDDEEHFRNVVVRNEMEPDTAFIACSVKVEKSDLNMFPEEESIKMDDLVVKESCGISLEDKIEDTMMSSNINISDNHKIQKDIDPNIFHSGTVHLDADNKTEEIYKLGLDINNETVFDPNLNISVDTNTNKKDSVNLETENKLETGAVSCVSLKTENSLATGDLKETIQADIHDLSGEHKTETSTIDTSLNVKLDHDAEMNIGNQSTEHHLHQMLESTVPGWASNEDLALNSDINVDKQPKVEEKLPVEGFEEHQNLSIELGTSDEKDEFPKANIEMNIGSKNKFGWSSDIDKSK